jgi:Tfp pilus assembly protein PilF
MRHLPIVLLLSIVLGMAACQTAPPVPPQPTPVEETLSVPEYLKRGMSYLEVGDAANARGDFSKALEQEPDNRTARTLLEQIDADPQEYLGREHFTYTVQRGQALSVIAQRYLGSSLKFYILARYNDITNPSLIAAGQTLKIPGKPRPEPAPPASDPVTKATRETPPPTAPAAAAERTAPEITTPPPAQSVGTTAAPPPSQTVEPAAVAQPPAAAAAAPAATAAAAPSAPPPARNTEAERLYQRGVAEYQAGQLEKSYGSLNQALRLDPENASARRQVAEVKPALVDQYHKQALVLYREQQNMCGAIRAWDKVLALEPNHSSALTYQDRAQRIAAKIGQQCR